MKKIIVWMLMIAIVGAWNNLSSLPPVARAIIECESKFNPRAINKLTSIGEDVGYFQINTHYHLKTSQAMGLDIYTPEDNITYGLWLLGKEGTRPWNASKRCWKPKISEEGY